MLQSLIQRLETEGLAPDLYEVSPRLSVVIHQTLPAGVSDLTAYQGTLVDLRDRRNPQTIYRLQLTDGKLRVLVYGGDPVTVKSWTLEPQSLSTAIEFFGLRCEGLN